MYEPDLHDPRQPHQLALVGLSFSFIFLFFSFLFFSFLALVGPSLRQAGSLNFEIHSNIHQVLLNYLVPCLHMDHVHYLSRIV